MTALQRDKALRFRALHEAPSAFVVANVWDEGSARMMASLGFPALATSSGASAAVLGRRDGRISRDEALAQARVICEATDLPVSADLENGFGAAPEAVAAVIALAAEAGLVGGSIEDATGDPGAPIFDLRLAAERVAAAAEAARRLDFPFTLTGRAENFLRGRPDLEDTIRRLQAYEAAGAAVLMAPGLPDLDAVRAVCSSVGNALQLHGRDQGQILQRRRFGRGRRQAHHPCDLPLSSRNGRGPEGGEGGARGGSFDYLDTAITDAGDERLPRRMSEAVRRNARHGPARIFRSTSSLSIRCASASSVRPAALIRPR